MEYVIVFSIGTTFGFVGAWLLLRTSLQSNLSKQYGALGEQLRSLNETTSQLQRVLVDRTQRGKWGERRALEILELVGLEKDKHYRIQTASKNDDGTRIIPDYTFEFPNNIFLHMDSKFPLEQYEAYLNADSEHSQQQHVKQFLKSVRSHVNDLSKKGYISPGQGTVNYVILFIPFESLFRFIHEQDSSIIDDALGKQVVMCSPLTLYVLISTIRQSIDAFAYSRAAGEIRDAIELLHKQWSEYDKIFKKVGKELEDAQAAYGVAIGVRERQLMKTFQNIELVTDKYRTFT